MEKEFVPYQPSLDLKELGFNEPCFAYYLAGGIRFKEYKDSQNKNSAFYNNTVCSIPTFQQAFRWFRENHNLMFQIYYLHNGNHSVIIHKTTPEYMSMVDQLKLSSGCFDEVVDCYSYEQAELECLEKLIEIVKENKK